MRYELLEIFENTVLGTQCGSNRVKRRLKKITLRGASLLSLVNKYHLRDKIKEN